MSFQTILPIAAGAAAGALCRRLLALFFAHAAPAFPYGTLAANWTGALLAGLLAELVHHPQWRLLLITGFLGSLTTFSAFSLETVAMMQAQRWGAASAAVCLNVCGSFALTALGIWAAQALKAV